MKPIDYTNILLVEDSDEDFITVQRAFQKAGAKNNLFRLKTGDLAVKYLLRKDEYSDLTDELPGVILLDLNLPGLDGREVLRIIKTEESLKRIPVIVLTTSGDQMDIDACYEIGANSYIQKPVEFTGFVSALSMLTDYWFEISVLPKTESPGRS